MVDYELQIVFTNKSMTYSKEKLKEMSGGDKVRTTYKVPTIKFNGNSGLFTLFPAGDFKNGTDITDVEITILRQRRTFTSYEKLPGTGGFISMFTNEHNSWEDIVTIFESKTGQNIKVVGTGKMNDLRAEFPTLRINSNCYCLYKDEVHKLVVKGKSRQSLVDTRKELAKDDVELFEKKFKLVPQQEQGNGGNVYYFLKFEAIGESDLNVIGPHMEAISKIMDKIDEEYVETNKFLKESNDELAGKEVDPSENEDTIPLEDATAELSESTTNDEEIDPADIPF